MSDPLDNALGLNSLTKQSVNPLPASLEEINHEIAEKIDTAEEHILSARDIAMQAVQDMVDIAQRSQNKGDYEVLNSLIKTYADVANMPVELEAKKQKLIKKEDRPEGGKVVNNNLFVGSTAELLKMLEDMKEQK